MADLSLILVMAVWGSSFPILRFFLSGAGGDVTRAASPLAVVAARMVVASLLLLGWLALRPQGRATLAKLFAPGALARGGVVRDGLFCGALLAAGFLLQTEGFPRTTASRSGFLTGLLVAFVPLLELIFFKKRPAPPALVALALAVAGMALLSGTFQLGLEGGSLRFSAPAAGVDTLAGDLLTVGCAVLFAGHILVLGRVASRHPVSLLLLLQLVCIAATAAVVGPLVETSRLPAAPSLWAAIVYLALFATLLAFGVQTWAQRVVTAVRIAILSALEPVFAALWAALLLGERLSAQEKTGGALIVLGVVVGEAGAAWWAQRARAQA